MHYLYLAIRNLKNGKTKIIFLIIQLICAIYFSTYLLISIINAIDANNQVNKMDLSNCIQLIESQHISAYATSDNGIRKYDEMIRHLKNTEGIKSVSGVRNLITNNDNIDVLCYDAPLSYRVNYDLVNGQGFTKDYEEKEYIPLKVLSEDNSYMDVNVKTIGTLKKHANVFVGGSRTSYYNYTDWFEKLTNKGGLILLPNYFAEDDNVYGTYNSGGLIIEYGDKEEFYSQTYKKIEEEGIGVFTELDTLETNNFLNIYRFNPNIIYVFICLLLLIIFGIGGYNILLLIEMNRTLCIYYASGMEWKKGAVLIAVQDILILNIPALIISIIFNNIISKECNYYFDFRIIVCNIILYLIIFFANFMIINKIIKKMKPVDVIKEEK